MFGTVAKQRPKVGKPQMFAPKKGDHFVCAKCGMAIEVTADCKGTGGHHARFECCGQPLAQQ